MPVFTARMMKNSSGGAVCDESKRANRGRPNPDRCRPSTATHLLDQLLIMLGAMGYVLVDSQFSTDSYFWGGIYTVVICTEMARNLVRAHSPS